MIAAIAVLVRIAAFLFAIAYPPPNEKALPVSPLIFQTGIDFNFYAESRDKYFRGGLEESISRIIEHYRDGRDDYGWLEISAPLLPLLLHVFDYREGNTLPLALFYLALSIALALAWLGWLEGKGTPRPWLLLFALLPNPLWFMLNISTDFLFAVTVALFYFSFIKKRYVSATAFILLSMLVRPHGVALVLFAVLHPLLIKDGIPRRARYGLIGLSAAALVPLAPIYFPYFVAFVESTDNLSFFGKTQAQYLAGIFEPLPAWIDIGLSWLSLLGAKVLYLVGLRPSYSNTPLFYVMLRAAAGFVLLPGLVYLMWRADKSERLFVGSFILPILLGASQDRYNLAFQPILFYYGFLAYHTMWMFLLLRTGRNRDTRVGNARLSKDPSRASRHIGDDLVR